MSALGFRLEQTFGRSGWPKRSHNDSGVRCAQRIPARFPSGILGIGVEMDGAIQQAPHPARQVGA